ncbi:hypothetical protein [Bacterioplanes sanyensis]|uniref:hypothetical protein n=1 Tax=Bacterioplanes sanyensis TaxID=1249553 RepID=UPI00167330C2|nr:hypothetical protein [Bacterioplanes sanyensis]
MQDWQKKRDYHTPYGQQYASHMNKTMDKPFEDSYLQSFDARNWQLPKPDMDMMKTAQYAWQTDTAQKKRDATAALKQSAKHAAQELLEDPLKKARETAAKVQKVKGQYDAFQQDGDQLQQHAQQMTAQKTAEMAQSLGRNAMLKAPGYLMPGFVGLAYRSFFTAKMVGNFGTQYNELSETHRKAPGTFKQQRDAWLESTNKSSK